MPKVTYFKPPGVLLRELEEVNLTVEEMEAFRLKDYEEIDQQAENGFKSCGQEKSCNISPLETLYYYPVQVYSRQREFNFAIQTGRTEYLIYVELKTQKETSFE